MRLGIISRMTKLSHVLGDDDDDDDYYYYCYYQ